VVKGATHQSKPSSVKAEMMGAPVAAGKVKTVPSGVNITRKLRLLKDEGVEFDSRGILINKGGKVLWDGPWKL
jgi:methylated-DNA-[protein]-cysteine S-methyltransferase